MNKKNRDLEDGSSDNCYLMFYSAVFGVSKGQSQKYLEANEVKYFSLLP